MNKKEYKEKANKINIVLEVLNDLFKDYEKTFNNEENEESIREQYGNRLNDITDIIYYLEQEKNYLEIHWDDDKLTASELYEMELIHNNID